MDNPCNPGERPKPFQDYLSAGRWLDDLKDSFADEVKDALKQAAGRPFKSEWREIGRLNTILVRGVRYFIGESEIGDLVLGERSPGLYAPLLRWSGEMPDASLFGSGPNTVLVVAKDFSAMVPMVQTWAWVWSPEGPVRLDVEGAIHEAIGRAAAGFTGYETGLDWDTLHMGTAIWPECCYPGQAGLGFQSVEAWFKVENSRLVIKRIEHEEPTPALESELGGISGRLVDPVAGKPIGGATVLLGDCSVGCAMTGRDGRFFIRRIPPGKGYILHSEIPSLGYYLPDTAVDVVPESITPMGDVRVQRLAAVSGIISDAQGEPVAGAWVGIRCKQTGVRQVFSTDDRGMFKAYPIQAGTYTLESGASATVNKGPLLIQTNSAGGRTEWLSREYQNGW